MKRLIVNADDFGLTSGINRAIVAGHDDGAITSATLMANSSRFHEAVNLAKARKNLGIGCHVVLVDGSPVASPDRVSSLLSSRQNGVPVFRSSFAAFAKSVLLRKIEPSEIEFEALSQMERIQRHGLALTHFDTHKHTHMLTPVLEPVLRAAKQMGIRALRNPFEPGWAIDFRSFLGMPGNWIRPLEVGILRRFMPALERLAKKYGFRYPDGTVGVALTGSLDEKSFTRLLRAIPDGAWELVCHPGYVDEELHSVSTRLVESREKELALLRSSAAKEVIRRHGIQLISFREL